MSLKGRLDLELKLQLKLRVMVGSNCPFLKKNVGHFPSLGKKCRPLSNPKTFGKLPALSVGQLKVPRCKVKDACFTSGLIKEIVDL